MGHVPTMLGLGRLYTRTLGWFLEDEDKVKLGTLESKAGLGDATPRDGTV